MNRRVKPWIVLAFLSSGLLLYGYFFFIPMVQAFYYSLTEWNGFAAVKNFVGLRNFTTLMQDTSFIISFQNTMAYMFFGGILVFALCLIFAYCMTKKGFYGRAVYSRLFYFPTMISQAALAVLWVFFFNSNFGLLTGFLGWFGVPPIDWLGSRALGITSLIFATSFAFVGFYLTLMLAGCDRIPDSYIEAAKIDGAGDIMCFIKITLPLLRDVMIVAITLWMINMIRYFELIYAMFKGASTAMNTMGTYMYAMAFGTAVPIFRLGYGSAIAVVMFLSVVVFTGVFRKIFDRESIQY
jgi:ABC-type sugar transport system permease subunit